MQRSPRMASARTLFAVTTLGTAIGLSGALAARADDTGGASRGPAPPEAGAVGKQPVTGVVPPVVPAPALPQAPVTKAPAAPRRPAAPPKPPLPVEMTIVAVSPDPPWTLRIKNTGEHPIRIAADTRLLTFELDTGEKRNAKVKCSAPSALRPRAFPTVRELYLDPGEVYAEDFDPRLYCFGDSIYMLHGGTTVRAHLGWPGKNTQTKGPFAAQGVDRPEAFSGLSQLSAPPILLSFAPFATDEAPADEDVASTGSADAATSPQPGSPAPDGAGSDKPTADPQHPKDPVWAGYRRAAEILAKGDKGVDPDNHRSWARDWANGTLPDPGETPRARKDRKARDAKRDAAAAEQRAKPKPDDRNSGHVDVYINHYSDASTPRDAVVNIRAVNDGKRDLVAAIRGRMLSFTVEELGPDNKAKRSFDCRGSDGPHAMPTESISDLGPGKAVSVPIILAEVCPPETFERPGLYRVRPRIDTEVDGEVLAAHPYIGKALAMQSSLIRVASSRRPYQEDEPKAKAPDTNATSSALEASNQSAPSP